MRVSTKSDYALRALIELAAEPEDRAITADELGKRQDIPHGFLQSILGDLRKAGILLSQRGQSGGWRMARPPYAVTIADVIRAVDGPLVSVYGVRPESVAYNGRAEVLKPVWIAARDALREVLETVTIAQLAEGELPSSVLARTQDDEAWRPH
ncbi:RrF2 family transcriptional regulator [Aeromicrobium duanguangcaii]|uniref:Rrf2 family transcriptional regulator n=1 Tax=Aeromicrobium duanguangcaii TaxID=2968086 RepID=A0ABY5KJ50_9ACTN|nr:Rrf2 family transcriptional regulator [Aeromicrobium duanguangcaii]MCD9153095.1 Rrf2 family transcriptional regulator [Aeromicrobium duanguangcaii]MCL3836909.1 Rrf2 family transcriptional regulator [Aeromicrobium duanguangcaii]UUI69804.1 Rrf2 family transcriptional regulator [Aeromicrobium duanguangcaii]